MAGPWFGRKRIGWGWSPRTWQGWMAAAGFVAIVIACAAIAEQLS